MTILDPVPGRSTSDLTRRDVVRSLLAVPANEAIGVLPGLRRDLVAAGNPLSAEFWAAAEQTLTAAAAGSVTAGEVRRWLQATGSEPIDLFPAQGFVWPDEDERGPVAAQMHAALVSHLERLVADAAIDPDRLLEGDPQAWTAYEQVQLTWLETPLPDGREPRWAIVDEHDEEFLAECDAADARARAALTALLADTPPRPRPDAALSEACARVRPLLTQEGRPHELLRVAGGIDPTAAPDDDEELWLALAAGVVTYDDEPTPGLDHDVWAAWMTLAHPEWVAAVVTLVRHGPGSPADPHVLARHVVEFEFEADAGDEVADTDTDDDLTVLTDGFGPVVALWSALGAVDAEARLTPLGWWGLPEALTVAWTRAER